jgi:hypothetical protein
MSIPADSPLEPPRSVAEIPGIGPIRARALQKAGFANLNTLREATLEQLASIPGITEIKARQIQTYLAQFAALPDPVPSGLVTTDPSPIPTSGGDLWEPLARTLHKIFLLWLAHSEETLRPRLHRELTRLRVRIETCMEQPACTEAARPLLLRVERELEGALAPSAFDKKMQGKLADTLAGINDALGAL